MAGAGYKNFSAGEVLTSSDVDTYLMEQATMVFANAAARDAALTAPSEGMLAYIVDTNLLTQYSGSAWSGVGPTSGAWRSWTPTLTNMTQGNGTVTARYMRIGRMIAYKFQFTLGSTSTVGTDPTFSVPVTAAAQAELDMNTCRLTEVGTPTNRFFGWAVGATTSTVQVGAMEVIVGILSRTQVTATAPFTWGNTDQMFVSGVYEASADAV